VIRVTAVTDKGGVAKIGEHVTVSYAVAGVADLPIAELLYVWVSLPGGGQLDLFFNRETGLFVADKINKSGTGGNEFVRVNVNDVNVPTAR
jgi:hypothetical protein